MNTRKNGSPVDSDKFQLRLYTAGQTPKSLAAIKNLKKVCEEHFAGRYEVEIVDLLKNPRLAKDDQIVGHPDAGAQAPRAGAQDHRRPFRHRAHAGGAAAEATELGAATEERT